LVRGARGVSSQEALRELEPKGTAFWAVLIVEHDGAGHFLCEAGRGGVAVYYSKKRAEEIAEIMRDGLGDEVQNVSVAQYYGEMCTGKFRIG
jgi:hypothetical protein